MTELQDAFRKRLLTVSYKDIINTCEVGIIKLCDDSNFWLDKMKFEIDYYNVPFYDNYEFLREALKMGQRKYFDALLNNSHLIPDDERIHLLFFKFGFMNNDKEIMQRFSSYKYNKNLIKVYNSKGKKTWKKIQKVIEEGIFTIDEYYQILNKSMKNYDFTILRKMVEIPLPVRYHPQLKKFDKLIFRYIGIGDNQDEQAFRWLVRIYTKVVSSYKRLYNLIYDTYQIESIKYSIKDNLYEAFYHSELDDEEAQMWINDDLNTFKKRPLTHISKFLHTFHNYDVDSDNVTADIIDFCYNNGKIINWIIENYITKREEKIIDYLSLINLNVEQFKLCLKKFNGEQYNYFFMAFLFNIAQYPDPVNSNRLRKAELLMEDKHYAKWGRNQVKNVASIYENEPKIDRDTSIILRETFKTSLRKFDYPINNPNYLVLHYDEYSDEQSY